MEICGHGIGYRTWSIMYKVFPGDISDAYDGAWEDLYQFIATNKAEFRRSDGTVFRLSTAFVDSGDGTHDTIVFDFCSRLRGFYPVKGAGELKESKQGHKSSQLLDEAKPRDRDKFRISKKNGSPYVLIHTNWYKKRLYRSLAVSVKRRQQDIKGSLYCDFPADYPDVYFDMLTAEEERADHTFWRPSGRANEALDLRVYNMCAGEFWLSLEVERFRKEARRAGHSKEHCDHIHSRHVLNRYAQLLAPRAIKT
jgi:phage terminase large subunit GpA-like protein